MEAYNGIASNIQRLSQSRAVNSVTQNLPNGQTAGANTAGAYPSFSGVLQDKLAENVSLNFSKHASLRLNARDIALSGEQLIRLEQGVDRAREKGIRDSLVLVDNVALLVNTASRTVITAVSRSSQNVFTNIDGAVIV